MYRIKTINGSHTKGYLYYYPQEGETPISITNNKDSGEGYNFEIEHWLTGGTKYLVKVTSYSDYLNEYYTGDYDILFSYCLTYMDVVYQSHVQNVGWQDLCVNGMPSGTSGQGLRLEGIKIFLDGFEYIDVEYRTHVQNIGWQDWVSDGEMSGTSGLGYRLEAINIRLTGITADLYDIYYRVHAQNFGWLDWAKDGASAGTAGFGYRLEAIEIVLAKHGDPPPGSTDTPFVYSGPPADDFDTLATARPLDVDELYTNGIDYGGDVDYYSFTPDTSGIYTFSTLGGTDTYGYLYDPQTQTYLEEDDDSGDLHNFTIYDNLTAGKTYYIIVTGYSGTTTGCYDITVYNGYPIFN